MVDKSEIDSVFDELYAYLEIERMKALSRATENQVRVEIDDSFGLLQLQWFHLRLVYMGLFVIEGESWWRQVSQNASQMMGLSEFWPTKLSPERLQQFAVYDQPVKYDGRHGVSYAAIMRSIILAARIKFQQCQKTAPVAPTYKDNLFDVTADHFDETGCQKLRRDIEGVLKFASAIQTFPQLKAATVDGQCKLLRSSFNSLKSRFQAMAEAGSLGKAWLIHYHDDGNATSGVRKILQWADGFDLNKGGGGFGATCAGKWKIYSDGREECLVPVAHRLVMAVGADAANSLGDNAAQLLTDLPEPLKNRLWSGLPEHTTLTSGLRLWALAVFELANANVVGSPLRAVRWVPTSESCKIELNSIHDFKTGAFAPFAGTIDATIPENPDWYATLDNFAASSVQAIDILQSWLDVIENQQSESFSIHMPDHDPSKLKSLATTTYVPPNNQNLDDRYVCDLFPCAKDALPDLMAQSAAGKICKRQVVGPGVNVTRSTYCPTDTQMATLEQAGGSWATAFERLVVVGGCRTIDVEKMDAPEILRRLAKDILSGENKAAGQVDKPIESQTTNSGGDNRGEVGRKTEVEPRFIFWPDGDGYYLEGFGEQGHFTANGAKGLHDLYRLVRSPSVPVPMFELDTKPGTMRPVGDSYSVQPAAHEVTLEEIRAKRKKLGEAIEEADDPNEKTRLEGELKDYEESISRLFCKTSRNGKRKVRDINNPLDNLRPKIDGRITTACKAIATKCPNLAKHLRDSCSAQGAGFVYSPGIVKDGWDTEKKQ